MRKKLALLLVLTLVLSIVPTNVFHAQSLPEATFDSTIGASSFLPFSTTPGAIVASPAAVEITSTNFDPVERTNFNAPVNINAHIGLTAHGRTLEFTTIEYEWVRREVANDRYWASGSVTRSEIGTGPGDDTNLDTLNIPGRLSQAQRGGRWYLRVTLFNGDEPTFYNYLFITNLIVQGGPAFDNNQNNQGQDNNDQGEDDDDQGEDEDDDDQGGGRTTVVINVNVTTTIITNVINQSITYNRRPNVVFVLAPGEGGIKVSGSDVQSLINVGGSITIVHNRKVLNITTAQMITWNFTATSEISIVIENVHRPSFNLKFSNSNNKPSQADTPDALHEWLLSVMVEVNISIDGVAVPNAGNSQSTISVDVSDLNLTDADKPYLVAVFFYLADPNDPDSLTYRIVEGFFDELGYFHVPLVGDGWFGFFLGDYAVNQVNISVLVVPTFTLTAGMLTAAPDGAGSIPMPFVNPITGENMFSLRIITYVLGGSIQWVAETNSAIVIWEGTSITIAMNNPLPGGYGTPIIVNNRAFLPEAFLSMLFEVEFNWDASTGSLHVLVPDDSADDAEEAEVTNNDNEDDDEDDDEQ